MWLVNYVVSHMYDYWSHSSVWLVNYVVSHMYDYWSHSSVWLVNYVVSYMYDYWSHSCVYKSQPTILSTLRESRYLRQNEMMSNCVIITVRLQCSACLSTFGLYIC